MTELHKVENITFIGEARALEVGSNLDVVLRQLAMDILHQDLKGTKL